MTLSKATKTSLQLCPHSEARHAWGLGQAARAYKIGELSISYICSSFLCALGGGGGGLAAFLVPHSHSTNNQDDRSVVNNHPPRLGTDRSRVYFTLWPNQLSLLLPKMQAGLGHTKGL